MFDFSSTAMKKKIGKTFCERPRKLLSESPREKVSEFSENFLKSLKFDKKCRENFFRKIYEKMFLVTFQKKD